MHFTNNHCIVLVARASTVAISANKLMIVQHSRGPSFICECKTQQEAVAFSESLQHLGWGVSSQNDGCVNRYDAASFDRSLELLAKSSEFQAYLAEVEASLTRRNALGLSSLF